MEQNNEGSIWFWRLFGGAIIGIIAILFGVILNMYSNSISRVSDELAGLRAKVAALDEFRQATKETIHLLESNAKERTDQLGNKDKEHDIQIQDLRERLIKIEQKIIS